MADINLKGYHGTVSKCADRIYLQGFAPSKKNYEWLGHGIYFFAKHRDAQWWSETEARKHEHIHDDAEVITVDIVCGEECFFDLDRRESMDQFTCEMNEVFASFGKTGGGAPKFTSTEQARCFCCNLYKKQHSNIKVMGYSFPTGGAAYNSVGFPRPISRRQYCINDESAIILGKREVADYAI